MNCTKLPYQNTGLYSKVYLDYISDNPQLTPFYNYRFSKDEFSRIIVDSNYNNDIRKDLIDVISDNYNSCQLTLPNNVSLLSDSKTFTITTGHQLNIYTGPLFFIYKIITTINLCKELKSQCPEYNFVPIYWMASEDHDSDEIDHFHLFGKKLKWETIQSGAVGEFNTDGIADLLEGFNGIPTYFQNAYSTSKTLSEATTKLVDQLFKDSGLVILDPNDARLKKHFSSAMRADMESNVNYNCILESNSELQKLGYSIQVNPREINLFYLEEGKRERIIKEDGKYLTKGSNKEISLSELDTNPERFSPNVVTRPMYQQVILPNLAYIGGPGELAYWLQLKSAFDKNSIQYPMFVPRNAALLVDSKSSSKFEKAGFTITDLLKKSKDLEKEYMDRQDLIDIKVETNNILNKFDLIKSKLSSVDKSLDGFGEKEKALLEKQLERLSGRLNKANKAKFEIELGQIKKLKEKYFPDNAPQERAWNILNILPSHPEIISELLDILDPFDKNYYLLTK